MTPMRRNPTRTRRAFVGLLALLAAALLGAGAACANDADSVQVEDLTWTELRDALAAGRSTLIIPVGGVEQNGPHMALGKHNLRAHALAARIAARLGNALVAPVVGYVPEGRISPPTEHMRFPGTISVPEDAFKAVIDATARSYRQHGFRDIVIVGDSGNYQAALKAVADRLNRDWAGSPARAHYVGAYYDTVQGAYVKALHDRGLSDAQIGTHAAVADTSLLMALVPGAVRPERFDLAAREGRALGVQGDPRAASAALGQLGVDLIVTRSVDAIRAAVAAPR